MFGLSAVFDSWPGSLVTGCLRVCAFCFWLALSVLVFCFLVMYIYTCVYDVEAVLRAVVCFVFCCLVFCGYCDFVYLCVFLQGTMVCAACVGMCGVRCGVCGVWRVVCGMVMVWLLTWNGYGYK